MHKRRSNGDNHRPPSSLSSSSIILLLLGSLPDIQRRRRPHHRRVDGIGGILGGVDGLATTVAFTRAEEYRDYADRQLSPASTSSSSSSISGFAFFDSYSDGIYDVTTSAGIYNTSVSCFDSLTGEIINTTITDTSGYYSFDGIDGGQYYISSTPPQWYAFSNVWNGMTDEVSGALLYPNVDSAINPKTGQTNCFNLVEGEDKTISFGLELSVWSKNAGPTASPSIHPSSNAPINIQSPVATGTTSAPTSRPSTPSIPPLSQLPPTRPGPSNTLPPESPSIASSIASLYESSPDPTYDGVRTGETKLPSSSPTRSGEWHRGPTMVENLVMNICGIEVLEDEEAWSAATSDYVMEYYNNSTDTVDSGAVFDVLVSIRVIKQTSSNGALNRRRRRRNRQHPQRRRRRRELRSDFRNGTKERRDLQAWKHVEVAYELRISSYETADPVAYDGAYVATSPFSSHRGSEGYRAALRDLSPYYDDVWSVWLTRAAEVVDPPRPEMPIEADDDDGDDGETVEVRKPPAGKPPSGGNDGGNENTIVYIVCGGAVVTASFALLALRRRMKGREESLEDAGSDDAPSGIRSIDEGCEDPTAAAAAASCNYAAERSSASFDVVSNNNNDNEHSGSSTRMSIDVDSLIDAEVLPRTLSEFTTVRSSGGASSSSSLRDVVAPPGKLGVVIDAPPAGCGPAYVLKIKDTCPILDMIRLEDKIVAVDDVDVREMSVLDVCRLLGGKSERARKITVLREVVTDDGNDDDDDDDDDDAVDFSSAMGASDSKVDSLATASGNPTDGAEPRMLVVDLNTVSASRSIRAARKITVSREVGGDGDGDGDDDDDDDDDAVSDIAPLPSSDAKRAMDASRRLVVRYSSSSEESDSTIASENIDIVAPAGTLGVIVDSDSDRGPAYVSKIKKGSSLRGKIRLWDELVAVDGEDVSNMNAFDVSKLLARKSGNPKRKITVLREDGSMVESDSVSSLPRTESTKNASSSFSSLAKTLSDSTLVCALGTESAKNASSFSSLTKTQSDSMLLSPPDTRTGLTKALSDSMLLSPPGTRTENMGNDESSPILLASSSSPSSQWNDDTSSNSETKINIVAPSGKLGLVIDDPPTDGGPSAYVCNIKEESPIKGDIRLGDKIVAINDLDVSNMKAVHVSMYLASKSGLEWRKITVVRENGSMVESNKTSSS